MAFLLPSFTDQSNWSNDLRIVSRSTEPITGDAVLAGTMPKELADGSLIDVLHPQTTSCPISLGLW